MPEMPLSRKNGRIGDYISVAGFLAFFLLVTAVIAVMLKHGIIRWPFRRVPGIVETYKNVLLYSPVLFIALFSTIWLKVSRIPVLEEFKWRRFSRTFLVGLFISSGYSVYLFMSTGFSLKGSEYWPPVVMLSLLNAVSEEVFYRLVFYRLLKNVFTGSFKANLIQSLAYASVHVLIGGVQFAVFAFCYGMLLGWIMERNRSVIPCIICHFCIDIGNIGLPLLIDLPVR